MSETVRKGPEFEDGFFYSLAKFEHLRKSAGINGPVTRCIYIQVQKVQVLDVFLKNLRIF